MIWYIPISTLILAVTSTPLTTSIAQLYCPESADSTDLRTSSDMYSVKDSSIVTRFEAVTDFVDGPVHTVFTVTGTSTAGLNSTVQVRVTLDPDKMGLDELKVRLTLDWRALDLVNIIIQPPTMLQNTHYICIHIVLCRSSINIIIYFLHSTIFIRN